MAKWIDTVTRIIVQLMEQDAELAKTILLTIKRLERKPTLGDYIQETYRVYYDQEKRFRIGYNFHPEAEEIEIVALHIASPKLKSANK
ncbi:hypothetical protein WDW89_18785 [Deltaproteobacteria bacterium TL4]